MRNWQKRGTIRSPHHRCMLISLLNTARVWLKREEGNMRIKPMHFLATRSKYFQYILLCSRIVDVVVVLNLLRIP